MTGRSYEGGALRFGTSDPAISAAERIAWGNGTSDAIYIALMDSAYVQDVTSVHWSEIVAHEISGAGYTAYGNLLTTTPPYIDGPGQANNTYPQWPYSYVVYTANAAATPAYSTSWSGITFTNISGACIFKKTTTDATSPLLYFLPDLSVLTTNDDKYFIQFGTPGTTLGIWHRQLF